MSQSTIYQEALRAFLKPVLKYLDDPSCSEILINGPTEIWIESKGRIILTDAKFTEEGLLGAARNMAQFVGRILNDERPRLDARLPDGSRIHVVLPPIARKGTTVAIRKFLPGKPGIEQLIEWGSMTAQMAWLIRAMVHTKLNIVVAGGTGSGKTTLLNIVSTQIPNDERILTIEDSAELQMQQDHIVPFESRPPDKFGKGEVNMGHLLHSALRLRPDRIVVGEVRGGEAFDLMQAMNTGHGGSMATTHANTPTDTLRRLESLCLQSGIEIPMVAIRAQVASAINAVITCERFPDGSRRTTSIAEVLPLDDKGDYRTQSIFVYAPTHRDKQGRIHGYHAPTGLIPTLPAGMQAHGFPDITQEFFDPKTYGLPPPPNIFAETLKLVWAPSLKHREENLPDSSEIKESVARAAEHAVQREKELSEKVKAKSYLEGYDFSSEHAEKEHGGGPPAAAASPAEPTRAAVLPDPSRASGLAGPQEAGAQFESPRAAPARGPPNLALPPATVPPTGAPAVEVEAFGPGTAVPGGAAVKVAASNEHPAGPARAPQAQARPGGPAAGTGAEPAHRPPPGRAEIRPSNLPPGKRPLPQRRNAAPVESAEEEDQAPPTPARGEDTGVHQMPDRFRK